MSSSLSNTAALLVTSPPAPSRCRQRQATKEKLLVDRQALPIWGCRKQLIDEIRANPVLVVVGETGSGAAPPRPDAAQIHPFPCRSATAPTVTSDPHVSLLLRLFVACPQ